MKILFVGDIFGSAGKRVLAENLRDLKEEYHIDVCIANGENVAGGIGITGNLSRKLHKIGIDVLTGGNHSFAHANKEPTLFDNACMIRPNNYPPGNPGKGRIVFTLEDGRKVGVINLLGRTFFNETVDCPFRSCEQAIEAIKHETKIILVDIHAEASSEKAALATYFDGKVTAVLGTHTHVQTADERIFPNGTAFITDVGMTGPENSIIGMKKKTVLRRFLLQTHERMEPASGDPMINAVILHVNESDGTTFSITRILKRVAFR